MKSLKHINLQTSNILCNISKTSMPISQQIERMKKVRAIAQRYRRNALAYIKATEADMNNFGLLPITREIYMNPTTNF